MNEHAVAREAPGPEVTLPDSFFVRVLPQIESLAELKVVLHLYWLLSRQRGIPRAVSLAALERDRTLLRSVRPVAGPRPAEECVREGLELAVARGTVLMLEVGAANHPLMKWYLLDNAESRAALEALRREDLEPASVVGADVGPVQVVRIYRPNVYTLYERNIGVLTPMVADQLRAAERDYPPEWIEDAMRLAVAYNKRNWAYVSGILKRWEAEGKSGGVDRRHPEQAGDGAKYTSGRYGHLVES
jgi:DNA replication protein